MKEKREILRLPLVLLLTVLLFGCEKDPNLISGSTPDTSGISLQDTSTQPSVSVTITEITMESDVSETTELIDTETIISVTKMGAIESELRTAIIELRQPVLMDVSTLDLSDNPEIDIKNIYYEIVREYPELKYAYDVSATLSDNLLACQISYMPYIMGNFPTGFEGETVSSMSELILVAESNIRSHLVDIHITNKSLEPDMMSRALQQVGGGYIICDLNKDATKIVYSVPVGMTMDECLAALEKIDLLAENIITDVLIGDMTEYEKASALYSYITETVKYDQRYYTDRLNMPYESQTALGALRDGIAICGGYSHAVKLLFEKAGIKCYNITGKRYGEYHMWNVALLDGSRCYFDATADRGNSEETGLYHFNQSTLDTDQYKWNEDNVEALTKG